MEGTETLACPSCRGPLVEGLDAWACDSCAAEYRGLRGIPDLRTADDLYLANQDDWEFALRLSEDFDRLDFRGLLERYYDLSPEIPPDLRRRQIDHIMTAPERAGHWLDALGGVDAGPLLDLGCGTGSFLSAVGGRFEEAWGIDIAMRWLLVARKRLDEEGLSHIRLVCGCSEQLPFSDGLFSEVVAGDVIEHVDDQAATLAESFRVLQSGGGLFMASPNRFSLAPEPHVGVWGVGYLPRPWMIPYVRWAKDVDYRAIRTLGLGEWNRLLASSPFGSGTLFAPGLPEADFAHFGPAKRIVGRIYNRVITSGLGQFAAKRVGPLFHVVCRRPADPSGRRPSPATRPGSTSLAASR